MTAKPKSPVAKHRARMARHGLVRVEVKVHKEDASLLRHVASALSDPSRRDEARLLLRQRFSEPPKVSLKALLACAPPRWDRPRPQIRSRTRHRSVSYLIDTNIISEVRKGARCDPRVSAWYASIADEDIFLSTLVMGEIRKGVELARVRDAGNVAILERWLGDVEAAFEGRLLGIDNRVFDQWGRMSALRSIPVIDGLLAATAFANGLTLVTAQRPRCCGPRRKGAQSVQGRRKSTSIVAPTPTERASIDLGRRVPLRSDKGRGNRPLPSRTAVSAVEGGKMKGLRLSLGLAALLAWLVAGADAQAQDFYKGKTLTILVGYPPGGGFDAYARLFGHYLGRHIPGNPDVIVSNMPGAVSLASVAYLDTNAPKDGTVIDAFDPSNIGASALGVALTKVDFRHYNWLGSISRGTTGCFVWHTLGIKTLADAKAHGPLHFGRSSAGSPNDMDQKILKKIFGVDVVQVSGYGGSTEEILAVERGETDGLCGAWTSLPAEWIAKHEIVPIIRSGPIASPDLPPDVPYIVDIAPTAQDRQIIRILMASEEVSRPYIVSAAVPADRVKILRAGFDAVMKDPDFLADADKQRLPISPESAAEAAKTVDDIYATPADVVAAARKIAGE